MKIEISKIYRYRNGAPARILCVDCPQPVISMDTSGEVHAHFPSGIYRSVLEESPWDLIEVREPKPRKVWVNEYPNLSFATWPTREIADMNATVERIACHEIDFPPIP